MQRSELPEDVKRRVAEQLASMPVLFAYLFGSQVTGHTHKESDADVAFYLDPRLSATERFDAMLHAAGRLDGLLRSPEGVDPSCLNEAPLLLRFVATTEGQLLYEKNHGARVDFELSTLRRYEETRPFRRAYRRVFLERILSSPHP